MSTYLKEHKNEGIIETLNTIKDIHIIYRKLGIYDFPQKDYKKRINNAIYLLLLKPPAFRVEFNKKMKKESIKPFQKVLKN